MQTQLEMVYLVVLVAAELLTHQMLVEQRVLRVKVVQVDQA
jgi:hypothetical protein